MADVKLVAHTFMASELYGAGAAGLTLAEPSEGAEFVGFSTDFSPPQNPLVANGNQRPAYDPSLTLIGIWKEASS